MRRIQRFTLLLLLVPTVSFAAEKQACTDKAATQAELNSCAALDLQAADAQLNQVYQAVLNMHRNDPKLLEKLKAAQRAWVKWRDAEMEAFYPEGPSAYGTVFPMCSDGRLASITRDRAKQLQQWIEGLPEGEVCGGSLPVKQ